MAGTIPVGAVVVDPGGVIAAQARNRIFHSDPPPAGQLAGSWLAHAELNAIERAPDLGEDRFDRRTLVPRSGPNPAGPVIFGRIYSEAGFGSRSPLQPQPPSHSHFAIGTTT